MLTRPERQTFEQIRARWETAQLGEEESAGMVGRKVPQQAGSEVYDSAGSKFRRRISNGLASISNTLSARKTTPGQQLVRLNPPPAMTAPTAESAFAQQYDALLSPTPKPKQKPASTHSIGSTTKIAAPALHDNPTKRVDSDATSKALPRSWTTSSLPRPVKVDIDASSTGLERTINVFSPQLVTDSKLRAMPSKIPTPSPPLSERGVHSPRQYLSHYTLVQGVPTATGYVRSEHNASSPSKTMAKSRTTPNLVKAAKPSQVGNYMAPRNPGARRLLTSPPIQKPTLQENIPTSKCATQRYPQMQEKTPRSASQAVPPTLTPRRPFAPTSPLPQIRQSNRGTPLTTKKRVSSNLASHTPLTARRAHPSEQIIANAPATVFVAENCSIVQPRLMGPRNPATPTPLNAEATGVGARPALPRSNTDRDLQRKILGTPNGLGGVWRSSRALAAANHEVRLPRSSTFHNFGRSWETAPPVPPIPDKYRTPSLPDLFQAPPVQSDPSYRSEHLRMVSDAASFNSIPEETEPELDSIGDTAYAATGHSPSSSLGSTESSDDLVALFALPCGGCSTPGPPSICSQSSQTSLPRSSDERPLSISELHFEDSADIGPLMQVRDYMSPLYWAGRFQSRYDQWRTEAMQAELSLKHRTQGQLGQCILSQEKIAACYIFAQLRDLCLTRQAADSLWVFESRYRKDHKLLGNPDYAVQLPCQHDNQGTQKGAFGRAVRKITPRKSSFVNLLKGKGWGKGDEVKPPDVSEPSLEISLGSS